MKISKALNLVVPIERENATLYVHATPISTEVFERYFLVIAKTFNSIYANGLGALSGARVAALTLRQVATDAGVWDGAEGVENGLMAEIRRLSNILILTEGSGWQMTPLQDALDKGALEPKEVSEVENLLVFFTVASSMHRSSQMPIVVQAVEMWGAQASSQTVMDLLTSLRTSTETETSPPKAKPSSHPS